MSKYAIKSLLFTAMCLFCAVSLFANNTVTVKSGKASVLRESAKAFLEIDYAATKVGDQTLDEYLEMRGENFVKNWPNDIAFAAKYFKDRFNKKNKGLKTAPDESTVSYKIIIHINHLNMGNSGSAFVPMASSKAGGIVMTGTVDIVDVKTNEVVCTLDVYQVKGVKHVSANVRMGLMFMELATKMCALK